MMKRATVVGLGLALVAGWAAGNGSLSAAGPPKAYVGVFKDDRPAHVVDLAARVGLHAVQLHGREPMSEVKWIRERVRFVIQGFTAGDPSLAAAVNSPADVILVDSPDPGSGRVFDWRMAEGAPSGVRLLLAGGLTSHNVADAQWYENVVDGTGVTHHTFAHLNQKTASLIGRVDYIVTRDLTVQIYAQPFVSKGTYSNVRELAKPRAASYDDRYQPYAVTSPREFNFKQFRSNLVVRWEYRPGSTLFLVWNQGRQDSAPAQGTKSIAADFGDLFDAHPDNTFLLKVSYWLER